MTVQDLGGLFLGAAWMCLFVALSRGDHPKDWIVKDEGFARGRSLLARGLGIYRAHRRGDK